MPRNRRFPFSMPFAFAAALLSLSVFPIETRAQSDSVIVERDVPAKMRDGVTLKADIFRPRADGKYPVLLQRTPYDKNHSFSFGMKGAARGYVVVVQDVRGRFTSEGEWYPFRHESQDGYDTVEWVAALPESNAKVGMFGGSYVGATQMLAAIASPPHLSGIAPSVTASNYHENWTYQGGAGSASRGPANWRRTPWHAASQKTPTLSTGKTRCRSRIILSSHLPIRSRSLPTTAIGWRIQPTTITGKPSRSKKAIRTSRCRSSISPRGTTFF